MADMLALLRTQAEAVSLLDRQRDQVTTLIDTWTTAVLPLLGQDDLCRWKDAVLLAQVSLHALDLSQAEHRDGLLRFARDLERIVLACTAAAQRPGPPEPC